MSLKKGANFPITADSETGCAFKQVHSDMNGCPPSPAIVLTR